MFPLKNFCSYRILREIDDPAQFRNPGDLILKVFSKISKVSLDYRLHIRILDDVVSNTWVCPNLEGDTVKRMIWICLLVLGFMLDWSMVLAADVYVESSGSCDGKTPSYSTIQEAINAATSGTVIKVAEGIYPETFVLNSEKRFTIQGGWDEKFKTQTPRTTAIRAPIVAKGGIAFQELRVMEIAGPLGNATTADVLDGKTFSSDTGTGLTGVMPNREGMNYTPTTTDQTIVAGYYNGSGKAEGDSDLVSSNIISGVNIFGVAGSAIVATGDAVAADVLAAKTFSNSSSAGLTGRMTDREGDNASTGQARSSGVNYFTAPEGYYDGNDRVYATDAQVAALDTGISTGNIR